MGGNCQRSHRYRLLRPANDCRDDACDLDSIRQDLDAVQHSRLRCCSSVSLTPLRDLWAANAVRPNSTKAGKAAFATGVWAVIFVVLFVLLGVGGKIVSNGLYMFPQGILGAWRIAVNWRLSGALPAWKRWFGMMDGLGLVLTGVCFVGITYVYFPDSLAIPAVAPEKLPYIQRADW